MIAMILKVHSRNNVLARLSRRNERREDKRREERKIKEKRSSFECLRTNEK